MLNKAFYRYAVFILFLLFSLVVVFLSNEVLIRNGDPGPTMKFLFVQFAMLFAFGASLHLLTGRAFRIRIRATIWTFVLSFLLIIANYLTAVYQGQLYTSAEGTIHTLMRMLLDDKNKALFNLLAGYLFGLSFFDKK